MVVLIGNFETVLLVTKKEMTTVTLTLRIIFWSKPQPLEADIIDGYLNNWSI